MWSYAARMWMYNRARRPRADNLVSAFEETWGRAYEGTLAPFGCKALTLVDPSKRDKFEERGKLGIVIGYKSGG